MRTEEKKFRSVCKVFPTRRTKRRRASAASQLSRKRRGFVGEVFGEDQILRAQRFVGLIDESLRGVVLRARVFVEQAIVDTTQVAVRARERRANRSLRFSFRGRRHCLQRRRSRRLFSLRRLRDRRRV